MVILSSSAARFASTFERPGKILSPERFVFPALILLGAVAWLGISTVQNVSDHARLAEVSLRHIEGMTYKLNALEETVAGEKQYTPQQQENAQAIRFDLRQELSELKTLSSPLGDQQRLEAALIRYWIAENDEFLLVRSGDGQGGEVIAKSRVDPAFAHLISLITDALQRNAAVAARANGMADLGTAGILLAAVLAIFALFRQFAGASRASASAKVRLAAQEMLRLGHRRLTALAANASDVIAITSPEGMIQYVSPNAERLWGCPPNFPLPAAIFSFVHPEDADHLQSILTEAIAAAAGENLKVEVRLCNSASAFSLSEIILTNLLDEPGVAGIVMTCRDVTERKAFEAQLTHQAFHDTLTGLPNRALLSERLRQTLARSQRTKAPVGLLFLDLDHFKYINDSMGHDAGDALLVTVAERLQACVRPGDTVARLGGDEFTILLEDLVDEEQATGVAERIVEALRTPLVVCGRELFVTSSVGIAISRGDTQTPEALLHDADTAMYQAKTSGKAQAVIFDRSMNVDAMGRLEMESDLRRALSLDELRVYYQPIMSLDSSDVSEVEALVRWEHPKRGLIEPGKFIPLAEETGLIVPLGYWVLQEACRQACEWHASYPDQRHLTVSVNLSARQLQEPDLVERVASVLSETGLSADFLKLEITETVMVGNSDTTIPKLHALKALGIRLAVDDFGTGYSSMAYLSRLPLDTLKIDRSFIEKMGKHGSDEAIVRAIVGLAKTLNLCITSEGIETAEQLAELKTLGCDQGQGFLFSRPLPKSAVEAFFEAQPTAGQNETNLALPRPLAHAA